MSVINHTGYSTHSFILSSLTFVVNDCERVAFPEVQNRDEAEKEKQRRPLHIRHRRQWRRHFAFLFSRHLPPFLSFTPPESRTTSATTDQGLDAAGPMVAEIVNGSLGSVLGRVGPNT